MSLIGQTVVDRHDVTWQIVEKLPSGATASVYKITSQDQKRAIKIYDERFWNQVGHTAIQRQRLQLQAELIGTHIDGIVNTYDVGTCPQHFTNSLTAVPYVIMDLVPGIRLTDLRGELDDDELINIFKQLYLSARELLRLKGVAHRDIKPDNIIYQREVRKTTLLDLGIAKATLETSELLDETTGLYFAGTVRYSPEEFVFNKVDYEYDKDAYASLMYYQLGATLFTLYSGSIPYAGIERPSEVMEALIRNPLIDQLESLTEVDQDSELVKLMRACLTRDYRARYTEVQDELRKMRMPLGRHPTVAVLYTGGTIAAVVSRNKKGLLEPQQFDDVNDPVIADLSKEFTAHFKQSYVSSLEITPKIDWYNTPLEFQIFSENATPKFHDTIMESAHRIAETYRKSSDKFLLGIIILHGTDTMVESALACRTSWPDPPCSIVFTGSNRNLDSRSTRGISNRESDGWKNVSESLYFLCTVGVHLQEVFVCFGSRVHLPISLAKTSAEGLSMAIDPRTQAMTEPFTFANYGFGSQYAFRIVDDIIVDSLYPIKGFGYTQPTGLRWSDISIDPPDLLKSHLREKYLLHSSCSMVSRGKPRPNRKRLIKFKAGDSLPHLKLLDRAGCILVTGFLTGSYPHRAGHPFYSFLEKAKLRGIPVFLVSETGLLPGEEYTEYTGVSHLYSVTPATAACLLEFVLEKLEPTEWVTLDSVNADQAQAVNRSLIVGKLRELCQESLGLMSYILGDITSAHGREKKLRDWKDDVNEKLRRGDSLARSFAPSELRTLSKHLPSVETLNEFEIGVIDSSDQIFRELWLAHDYELRGALGDYCDSVHSLGFAMGVRKAESIRKQKIVPKGRSKEEACRALITACVRVLNYHGVLEIDCSLDSMAPQFDNDRMLIAMTGSVSDKGQRLRDFPNVSVACLGTRFRDTLRDMRYRTVLGISDEAYEMDMEAQLRQERKNLWTHRVPAYFFYGFGLFRALCASVVHIMGDMDQRQVELEELGQYIHFDSVGHGDGRLNVTMKADLSLLSDDSILEDRQSY